MILSERDAARYFGGVHKRRRLAGYGEDPATQTAVSVVPVPGFQMSPTPKGFLIAVGFSVAVSLTVTAILRWWERRS